jgi:hypothetical protein
VRAYVNQLDSMPLVTGTSFRKLRSDLKRTASSNSPTSLPDSFGQSSTNAFIKIVLSLVIVLDHPDKPGDDIYWRRVMTFIGAG